MKTIKHLLSLVVIFFTTMVLYAQSADDTDPMVLKEFQLQTEKWRQAYNSGDAQNLVPLYSEDAEYISSHVDGLVAHGREKLIANFQNGINTGGHIDMVEILSMNISGDLATLLCKYQATNSGEKAVGRNLLVLKKVNGTWLIVLHMTVV